MPFLTTADAERGLALLPPRLPQQDEPTPAFLTETVPAAFRQGNSVGAGLTREWSLPSVENADFDPFGSLEERYQPFARSFIQAENPADVGRIKRQIDQELDDRRTLSAAGGAGVAAGVVAGILDPINLLPVAGAAARTASRAAGALEGAVTTARAGLLSSTAQEAVLTGMQETRTPAESALNIATATLLSGVLGGAVGAIRRPWRDLEASAARDLTPPGERAAKDGAAAPLDPLSASAARPPLDPIDPMLPGQLRLTASDLAHDTGGRLDLDPTGPADGVGSVGAAMARAPVAEERLVSSLGLDKAIAKTAPLLRLATSPSIETRRVTQELLETPFVYEKNALGVASPTAVETRVKLWDAPLAQSIGDLEAAFVRYRTGRPDASMMALKAGDLIGGARRAGRLTFDQFKEEVGRAMRRGDEHAIPEVAEAARAFRSKLFDPLKEHAIRAGLLPEDVKVETATSYLSRVYNTEKIKAQRPAFVRTVTDWLTSERDGAADRLADHRAKVEALAPQAERERAQVQETASALGRAQAALNSLRSDRRAAINEHRRTLRAVEQADTASPAFKEFMADVRRGRPAGKPPLRLAAWLVKQGGVRDQGGEVRALGFDHKTRPGLINNKGGKTLDDAARAAWEAGYIGTPDERPAIDDFLSALQHDVNGKSPIHRSEDIGYTLAQREIDQFREMLDREGLDIAKLNDGELEARIAVEREGPITDAEARQLEIDAALVTDRRGVTEARAREAGKRLEGIRAKVAEAKSKRDEMELWLANRKDALRDTEAGLKKAEAKVKETVGFARADDLELEDIAQQIADRILGAPAGRIPYDAVPLARGPLKERTFNIPDHLIEPFLESDVEMVARHYRHSMAPDVELARTFGRADLSDQIAKISEDYVQKMRGTTDERVLRRLDGQRRADIRDLEAMRDRVRGTYAAPADPDSWLTRSVPIIANYNYIRMLGQMTVSSIGDLARPVAVHGITRVFGDGLAPWSATSPPSAPAPPR